MASIELGTCLIVKCDGHVMLWMSLFLSLSSFLSPSSPSPPLLILFGRSVLIACVPPLVPPLIPPVWT